MMGRRPGIPMNSSVRLWQISVQSRYLKKEGGNQRKKIPKDRRSLFKKIRALRGRLRRATNSVATDEIIGRIKYLDHCIIEYHRTERVRLEESAISKIKNNHKYFFS